MADDEADDELDDDALDGDALDDDETGEDGDDSGSGDDFGGSRTKPRSWLSRNQDHHAVATDCLRSAQPTSSMHVV